MLDDINIYYVDMPYKVSATLIANSDTTYTIYINSRLSLERQYTALLHELKHINNNDLYNKLCVNDLENLTHKDD